MRVLLIDAFDSFVFNLEQYYAKVGAKTKVVRVNDNPMVHYRQWNPDLLVLGPGPGTPKEHGYINILHSVDEAQPILGVCLGQQAIGEYFGWKLVSAPTVEHGKKARVKHDGQGVFTGVPSPVAVIRYHSLAITDINKKNELIVTAFSEKDHVIMGIRHCARPIEGVQFHPESIGTEYGVEMIRNSLSLTQHTLPSKRAYEYRKVV